MEHENFIWNCENYIVYLEILLDYTKQRKNATRKKARIAKHLCSLKAGYRPIELLEYF